MPGNTSSGISRRLESTIRALGHGNHEEACVNLFPALDKTAKLRRPNTGVGNRIRSFIDDYQMSITAIATRNIVAPTVTVNGVRLSEAIYEFCRCPIVHEGQLDPRLTISDERGLQLGGTWNLPPSFIFAMCVSIIIAPENTDKGFIENYSISIFDRQYDANDFWGAQNKLIEIIEREFSSTASNSIQ